MKGKLAEEGVKCIHDAIVLYYLQLFTIDKLIVVSWNVILYIILIQSSYTVSVELPMCRRTKPAVVITHFVCFQVQLYCWLYTFDSDRLIVLLQAWKLHAILLSSASRDRPLSWRTGNWGE